MTELHVLIVLAMAAQATIPSTKFV